MTKRQIITEQKKIEKCKAGGCYLEALLKNYHLNTEILKFISLKLAPEYSVKNVKPKEVLNNLIVEVSSKPNFKTIIAKKNLKMLKPWLSKMDLYFKALKLNSPTNTKSMLHECEKISAILNISLSKILISNI